MAKTIEELSGILTRLEIGHKYDEDGDIGFGFPTKKYTNSKGEKGAVLFVRMTNPNTDHARFFLTCYAAYDTKGSKHRGAFLKLCSLAQLAPDPVQWQYRPEGTINACIEIPLADNGITPLQFAQCLEMMVRHLEETYEPLHTALTTGEMNVPEEWRKIMAEVDAAEDTSAL